MAMAMAGLMNGERAVVLLFIGRVLFSLPLSLLFHGIALSLLALSALSLDILADSSTSLAQFNTRSSLLFHFSNLRVLQLLQMMTAGIIVIFIVSGLVLRRVYC